MSFLDNVFQDPKYQTTDPRKPEEIEDPEIIISPDTRREKRIPPGQSRTKKWPVLDAHGTPDSISKRGRLKLMDWSNIR